MAAIDDYIKFLTVKPAAQREIRTLEFFHPEFSSVQRFVRDFIDQTLTLESDAPRNAGQSVLFTAISMDVVEPAESQEGLQVLSVSLGATNDEIQDQVNQITPSGIFTPIECIYRKYYSGNLSEPVLVLNLSVSSLGFEGYTKNNIIAEDQDLASKSSGELYTLDRFPTLRNI